MISETYDNDIEECILYHLNNFLGSSMCLKQTRHTVFHHIERT